MSVSETIKSCSDSLMRKVTRSTWHAAKANADKAKEQKNDSVVNFLAQLEECQDYLDMVKNFAKNAEWWHAHDRCGQLVHTVLRANFFATEIGFLHQQEEDYKKMLEED